MLNVFTHIKNNSTWLLYGEIIVVFRKENKNLNFITRDEFIMNAQKYDIKEDENNYSQI